MSPIKDVRIGALLHVLQPPASTLAALIASCSCSRVCAAPLDRREASHTHLRHVDIGASTTAPEKRACAAIESRARLADLAGRTSGGRDALLTRAARRAAASHRRESAVHEALSR